MHVGMIIILWLAEQTLTRSSKINTEMQLSRGVLTVILDVRHASETSVQNLGSAHKLRKSLTFAVYTRQKHTAKLGNRR